MSQLVTAAPPIVLVGLPGSGKTTVGEALARHLAGSLIDLDEFIVELSRRSIDELFEEGEAVFRDWETRALHQVLGAPTKPAAVLVVASGGGIVERPENRQLLREGARVVYLEADLSTLGERLRDDTQRPLLRGSARALEVIAARRIPWYESVSDVTVGVQGRTPQQIAGAIAQALESGSKGGCE